MVNLRYFSVCFFNFFVKLLLKKLAIEEGKTSDVLREANIRVRNLKFCKQRRTLNKTSHICAGSKDFKDSCQVRYHRLCCCLIFVVDESCSISKGRQWRPVDNQKR